MLEDIEGVHAFQMALELSFTTSLGACFVSQDSRRRSLSSTIGCCELNVLCENIEQQHQGVGARSGQRAVVVCFNRR